MAFEILRNDLTRMAADAVVNTANPEPTVGSGVDQAIHTAAGPELLAARKKIGKIPAGEAAITPGYGLGCKYVIHTVGPVWQDGTRGEAETLRSCYERSLALAWAHRCRSVAFPLISAGNYGFPREKALEIAGKAIRAFLADHEMDVFLVVYDRNSFRISQTLFDSVSSFIDDHYVEAHRQQTFTGLAPNRRRDAAPRMYAAGMPEDLGDLMDHLDASFSETLLALMDQTGKKDSEIYKKANVDRKLFSKIRSNPDYRPSKATALAFALALELDLDQTRDLIARAGYALSHSSKFDVIVEYFIRQGIYDLFVINETLFAFDQNLLGR